MKREEVIEIAKVGGMKASFGKTTDGKYAPNVNALGSSIPVEWLEAAFNEVERLTIEKCAQVCIKLNNYAKGPDGFWYPASTPGHCAIAIRALANQQEKQNG